MLDKLPEPDARRGFIEVANYLKIRENLPPVLADVLTSGSTADGGRPPAPGRNPA